MDTTRARGIQGAHKAGYQRGHNKFSDCDYFELGDFMPAINEIMRDLGMTAITSPMSKASLKACHEVQNLGVVETCIRRYLWQAALRQRKAEYFRNVHIIA